MGEVPLYADQPARQPENLLQGLLEHKVHRGVGAYSRPMPVSLGPPYTVRAVWDLVFD